jgi:hypothetical protein
MKGTTNQRYTTALVSPKPIIIPSRHYKQPNIAEIGTKNKTKKKKQKKKKKKTKKKNPNSTPNGKLGNTSFAHTTRMELRRPHPGIHVRSTPKRTTSSFYTPIKFRRENNPQKEKGQHGSKHGMKDYYRPSKHTINRRLGEVQHS